MTDAVTDTHALIWYLEDSPRLGAAARDTFDASDRGEADIFVPTIRIIAATALHLGLPLISRDQSIRLSDISTIW